VERDALATGLAIMTVHLGRRDDGRTSSRPDELVGDERLVADGKLILDLIGDNPTSEDVGELIVALGMLGALLAEEAGDASGRPAAEVLRELALRYAA
jgi:hypothetical protein